MSKIMRPENPKVLPSIRDPVAHRNASLHSTYDLSNKDYGSLWSYGVPSSKKILTVELYIKRFDQIRYFLIQSAGLTLSEREAILRLLRIYCYYGRVYPKAEQIADDFGNMTRGCSKRSFWRAIAKLREDGFIQVGNRFLHGRQISNCYRLDKLVICLVRYLMEHGSRYLGKISRQLLDSLANPDFWRLIHQAKVNLAAERVQFKFI
ncbi:hypothetical protein ES705_05539 [subsurface metagenome]